MNKRFLGVLIFAFVVASVASLMLYRLLLNRPQSAKAAQPAVQIVLATHDLEVGTVLKEEDVKLADWPGAVPAGAATKPQDVVGRGVITPIFAKEPVIESRLAPKGAGGGLAAMIPPGMRAVAVRVNEVVGVAGFVVPGMRVDVLISGNKPGGNTAWAPLTRTLLQNMEVLSAGQDFKKDAEGKPVQVQVVNLLVTPEQAEQLSLAATRPPFSWCCAIRWTTTSPRRRARPWRCCSTGASSSCRPTDGAAKPARQAAGETGAVAPLVPAAPRRNHRSSWRSSPAPRRRKPSSRRRGG